MKEKILALLGSEAALPERYYDTLRRTEYLEPEKALLLAILEDAIHCYRKYGSAPDRIGKERFLEAEDWIMHGGDDWIFSFENVCEILELDPQYVRRGLHEWKEKRSGERKAHPPKGFRGHAA